MNGNPLAKKASIWSTVGKALTSNAAKNIYTTTGGGIGNVVLWNPDSTPLLDAESWKDPTFVKQKTLDFLLGAGGGALLRHGAKGLVAKTPSQVAAGEIGAGAALIGMTGAKNLVMNANKTVADVNTSGLVDKLNEAATQTANGGDPSSNIINSNSGNGISTGMLLGGGVGLAGLIGGGLLLNHYLNKKRDEENAKRQSSDRKTVARIKIPDADGNPDNDTELEIPLDNPAISNALQSRLATAARRSLSRSAKQSQKKKDPNTGKSISYSDYVSLYGTDEEKKEKADAILAAMPKYASQAGPPPAGGGAPKGKGGAHRPVEGGVVPAATIPSGGTDNNIAKKTEDLSNKLFAIVCGRRPASQRMASEQQQASAPA